MHSLRQSMIATVVYNTLKVNIYFSEYYRNIIFQPYDSITVYGNLGCESHNSLCIFF